MYVVVGEDTPEPENLPDLPPGAYCIVANSDAKGERDVYDKIKEHPEWEPLYRLVVPYAEGGRCDTIRDYAEYKSTGLFPPKIKAKIESFEPDHVFDGIVRVLRTETETTWNPKWFLMKDDSTNENEITLGQIYRNGYLSAEIARIPDLSTGLNETQSAFLEFVDGKRTVHEAACLTAAKLRSYDVRDVVEQAEKLTDGLAPIILPYRSAEYSPAVKNPIDLPPIANAYGGGTLTYDPKSLVDCLVDLLRNESKPRRPIPRLKPGCDLTETGETGTYVATGSYDPYSGRVVLPPGFAGDVSEFRRENGEWYSDRPPDENSLKTIVRESVRVLSSDGAIRTFDDPSEYVRAWLTTRLERVVKEKQAKLDSMNGGNEKRHESDFKKMLYLKAHEFWRMSAKEKKNFLIEKYGNHRFMDVTVGSISSDVFNDTSFVDFRDADRNAYETYAETPPQNLLLNELLDLKFR